MDLLKELEQLVQNYKNSKNNNYNKFIDLCCEAHSKYLELRPGLVMILPLRWEEDIINALHITPTHQPVYFEIQNPFGELDMLVFAVVKEPQVYKKTAYESK